MAPKPWLTTEIRTSCAKKRKMFVNYRISNNITFKTHYKNNVRFCPRL